MQITWFGQSCFQITASRSRGETVDVVIDPFSEEIGLKLPKMTADVLLVTHDHYDHNNKNAVGGNPLLFDTPGEYEAKKVFVRGIPSFHDNKEGKEKGPNIIYTVEVEELRICHLGDLGQAELTPDQLEKIGDIDILMVPVGGEFTLSAKEAMKVMSQIEPRITIPMHYSVPKLKIKLESVDDFLKMAGIKKIEPENKLSIKKKDILPDEAKIIVLKHD